MPAITLSTTIAWVTIWKLIGCLNSFLACRLFATAAVKKQMEPNFEGQGQGYWVKCTNDCPSLVAIDPGKIAELGNGIGSRIDGDCR